MKRNWPITSELAMVLACFVLLVALSVALIIDASAEPGVGTELLWSAALLGATIVLGIVAFTRFIYVLIVPLRGISATVRRRAGGEYGARARVTGSAEAREIAQSVNDEADASDRVRAVAAESNRLRAVAREAGVRIREPLLPDEVLTEAQTVLEQSVASDVMYLRLLEDDRMGRVIGHQPSWLIPDDVIAPTILTVAEVNQLRGALRAQRSLVFADVLDKSGEHIPPGIRDTLRRGGVESMLITPFGVDQDLLGFVVAQRLRPARPWSPAEVDAVESIATDLGRGLHHARMYEAESRLVHELREVDQRKSEFLASVSHELRTPLASIAGYVEVLADQEPGPLNDGQRTMLSSVSRNTERLRTLIEDVLTLSKIESGSFRTGLVPTDLAGIVRAAVTQQSHEGAARGVTMTTEISHDLVTRGDSVQLERVMTNLLSNAVKFTRPGGHVDVKARDEGGSAVVEISDTGIGIPGHDLGRVFSGFFRGSNAVEEAIPGTGLGLAIVRTIVGNHRGEVRLESREGAGTRVTVRLPLVRPPSAAGGPASHLPGGM